MSDKHTHIVEVIWQDMALVSTETPERRLALKIEAAYARLNELALKDKMVILGTFQQLALSGSLVCLTITCQWVNRADLEAEQRKQWLMNQNVNFPGRS